MKKYSLFSVLLVLLLLPLAAYCQSRGIYTSTDFAAITKNENTMAILPFNVTLNLRPKDRANITDAALKAKETEEGYVAQNAMETFLLRTGMHKDYTVNFQDVNKTNALLKQHGISRDSLTVMTPESLCNLLGVQAVLSGTLISSHPLSTEAAVAVDILVGFGGKTNSGKCSLAIHDGAGGKLVWKYDKSLSRGLGSDVNTIIDNIMKKASRKFPYNK